MAKPRKTTEATGAITLRNLPEPVARAVREHATRYHVSLNKAVIQLLEGALRPGARKRPIRDDLSRLAGSLSPEAGRAMERRLAELRKIDPADWR
ncbi:MAG TPA: hypothetical protein VGI92_13865 [Gemmatimonadales bacterium]|jgi:plasmid stability protein